MSKRLDLVGKKFSKLTVIKFAYIKNQRTWWICKCECGNEKAISGNILKNNKTKSCGCTRKGKISHFKHGMTKTKFYKVWVRINNRCSNKKNPDFKDYGGRGINVCDRWSKFENFFNDMYGGYLEHKKNNNYTSIDRINNNLGYSPNNTRWANRKVQSNNKRNNRFITYKGKTQTMKQWSEELNISYETLCSRLRYGWPVNKIFKK